MKDTDLLFYDPADGSRLTYGDLRNYIQREQVPFSTLCSPRDEKEAILVLLVALILGHPLVLFDAGSVTGNESDVGYSGLPEKVASVPGRVFVSVAEMICHAKSGTGFTLTLYTSGSTGLPKQVTHTLGGLTRVLREGPRHAADIWGLAYNPCHIAGVQVIMQAFFNGNAIIQLYGRDRHAAISWLEAFGVTHLSATPSFYRLLIPVGRTLQAIRSITLGGERVDLVLIERLKELFPNAKIKNLYASTEAGTLLMTAGDVFTVPTKLEGLVRLRRGELELHRSLLGDFAFNERSITETSVAHEWYATGDVVEIVGEVPLSFKIVGREREWVNVGGHKVNPAEVEAVLTEFPSILEARVYGRANSVVGQILCAEVVAKEGFSEVAARVWLSERLQPAKIPRLIRLVSSIKRTRTGKIARVVPT